MFTCCIHSSLYAYRMNEWMENRIFIARSKADLYLFSGLFRLPVYVADAQTNVSSVCV